MSSGRITAAERAVLEAHHAYVKDDNPFQGRARLMQALWREAQGLDAGHHRDELLGSRLAMPDAEHRLTNYLTETIRSVVRREVIDSERARAKVFARPRIFSNLLSSQPLCFNLFGELAEDLELATRVFRRRLPVVDRVTAIDFEWSPGRGDERYTGDRSAFDVLVRYVDVDGERSFVGIEVKYHESLQDAAAKLRPRYDEVAAAMGCFRAERIADLKRRPLQQVWRDHLLAGAVLQNDLGFERGLFVVLYPHDNVACRDVLARYAECLRSAETFVAWTMEDVVEDIRDAQAGPWIEAFYDRYLAFEKAESVLPPH